MKNASLIAAAQRYYDGKDPRITDEDYDTLLAMEVKANPAFNIFDKIECTHKRIPHPIWIAQYQPPRSRTKFKDIHELDGHHERGEVILPKYDGCSVSAYYHPKTRHLYRIITRSDEKTGMDKTEYFKDKVPTVVAAGILRIDYEAIVTIEDFGPLARFKANGLVTSKHKKAEANDKILFMPFFIATAGGHLSLTARFKAAELSHNLILLRPDRLMRHRKGEIKIDGKTYPMDGFVYYNENRPEIFRLKKYHRQAEGETTVKNIEWNESPKKQFIPKVILEPVVVDGITIKRVATGGYRRLYELKCGIGARIGIVRAGSTIPKINRVLKTSENYGDMTCPHCKAELIEINKQIKCSWIGCSNRQPLEE